MYGFLIVRASLLPPVKFSTLVFRAEWLMDYGGWSEDPELARIFETQPEAFKEAEKLAEFLPVIVPIAPLRDDTERNYSPLS